MNKIDLDAMSEEERADYFYNHCREEKVKELADKLIDHLLIERKELNANPVEQFCALCSAMETVGQALSLACKLGVVNEDFPPNYKEENEQKD